MEDGGTKSEILSKVDPFLLNETILHIDQGDRTVAQVWLDTRLIRLGDLQKPCAGDVEIKRVGHYSRSCNVKKAPPGEVQAISLCNIIMSHSRRKERQVFCEAAQDNKNCDAKQRSLTNLTKNMFHN